MSKKPIRYSFKGHSLDGTSTVFVADAIYLSIVCFFAGFLVSLVLLWRDLPFFPMAQGEPVSITVQNHETDKFGYPEVTTTNQIFTGHKAEILKEKYGAQSAYNPIEGFFLFQLANHISYFRDWFRCETYYAYKDYLDYADSNNQLNSILYRWLASFLGAFLFAGLGLWLGLNDVFEYEKQIDGRILHQGKEGYRHLKSVFARQIANNDYESLILETDMGLNPNDPSTFDDIKPSQRLTIPDKQRRTHFLFLAGSRRGKTNTITKFVMQIYYRIRKGEIYKMIILDTPKMDYLRFLKKKHVINIAPDMKDSVAWHVSHDLALKQDVEQFCIGQIPEEKGSKDQFWTSASRGILVACIVYLNAIYGEDWTLANLSYVLKFGPKELEPIIKEHYFEMYQTIQMGENPISSVLGTMENYTKSFIQLAEIWDGFQYKHNIIQMSVRLLKHEIAIANLAQHLFKLEEERNYGPNTVFRGLIRHMNSNPDGWKWSDLAQILEDNYQSIFRKSSPFLTTDESRFYINTGIFGLITLQCKSCFNVAWSSSEQEFRHLVDLTDNEKLPPHKPKIFKDENDFVSYFKIITADASGNTDNKDIALLLSLYRKYSSNFWKVLQQLITQYINNHNLSGFLQAMAEQLSSYELAHIFDSNQDDFATLIRGCEPIFGWHATWDEYETRELFSFKDWIYDENPKRKIVCFSPSGRAKNLVQGLTRGLMMFMTGIVNDGYFTDDKEKPGIEYVRKFYIFADEVQSLGNMDEFIKPAMELFASRGITLVMACQDIAQLIELYTPETIDFMLGNTGNIFCIGANTGVTTEKIAGLLSKRSINKLHISESTDTNTGSTSIQKNHQTHNDEWVLRPEEVNSKLGLNVMDKINPWENKIRKFLKMRPRYLPIRLLYIISNINDAYILESPVIGYDILFKREMADWLRNIKRKPDVVDINRIIQLHQGKPPAKTSSGGGSTSTATEDKQQEKPKSMQWQAVEPESRLTQSLWVQEPTGDIPDDDPDHVQAHDLTQYEAELEAVELGTDIVQDMALEHISASTHVEAIKVIKDIAEVLEDSSKPKATTSKAYADKIKQKALDAKKGREAFIVRGDDPFDRKR